MEQRTTTPRHQSAVTPEIRRVARIRLRPDRHFPGLLAPDTTHVPPGWIVELDVPDGRDALLSAQNLHRLREALAGIPTLLIVGPADLVTSVEQQLRGTGW
jgi:hypothetical protein